MTKKQLKTVIYIELSSLDNSEIFDLCIDDKYPDLIWNSDYIHIDQFIYDEKLREGKIDDFTDFDEVIAKVSENERKTYLKNYYQEISEENQYEFWVRNSDESEIEFFENAKDALVNYFVNRPLEFSKFQREYDKSLYNTLKKEFNFKEFSYNQMLKHLDEEIKEHLDILLEDYVELSSEEITDKDKEIISEYLKLKFNNEDVSDLGEELSFYEEDLKNGRAAKFLSNNYLLRENFGDYQIRDFSKDYDDLIAKKIEILNQESKIEIVNEFWNDWAALYIDRNYYFNQLLGSAVEQGHSFENKSGQEKFIQVVKNGDFVDENIKFLEIGEYNLEKFKTKLAENFYLNSQNSASAIEQEISLMSDSQIRYWNNKNEFDGLLKKFSENKDDLRKVEWIEVQEVSSRQNFFGAVYTAVNGVKFSQQTTFFDKNKDSIGENKYFLVEQNGWDDWLKIIDYANDEREKLLKTWNGKYDLGLIPNIPNEINQRINTSYFNYLLEDKNSSFNLFYEDYAKNRKTFDLEESSKQMQNWINLELPKIQTKKKMNNQEQKKEKEDELVLVK